MQITKKELRNLIKEELKEVYTENEVNIVEFVQDITHDNIEVTSAELLNTSNSYSTNILFPDEIREYHDRLIFEKDNAKLKITISDINKIKKNNSEYTLWITNDCFVSIYTK